MQAFCNSRTIFSMLSKFLFCASRKTSIRFAPTQKFSAWLAITIPANSFSASATPSFIIAMMSPSIAFILVWNSRHRTPSPMSTLVAPWVPFTPLFPPCHAVPHAQGGPLLEGHEGQVEPPLDRIVDVNDVVGDFGDPIGRIQERLGENLPCIRGGLVVAGDHLPDPLPRIVFPLRAVERRQGNLRGRTVVA